MTSKRFVSLGLPAELRGKRKEKGDCMPYEEKEKLVLDGEYQLGDRMIKFFFYKIQ